jgi:uncharacterized protein YjbJ (UPF0337 family)
MQTANIDKNIEKNWPELKGKIQSKWSKFSNDEIEGFKGNLSLVTEKIESIYHISKEDAERQYESFRKSVEQLLKTDVAPASDQASSSAAAKPKNN